MSETATEGPAEERRGGDKGTTWGAVRPGQPFPEPEEDPPGD